MASLRSKRAKACPDLVVVVVSVKEGLFPEDHAGQHTAQTPHVQTVVIHLKQVTAATVMMTRMAHFEQYRESISQRPYLIVHQQLGALEVPGGHTDIIFLVGVVELGQAPVYKAKLQTYTQLTDQSKHGPAVTWGDMLHSNSAYLFCITCPIQKAPHTR